MTRPCVKPAALQSGDKVGVISTSCWVEEADLNATADFLALRGYDTFIHPQATKRLHQVAGTTAERTAALHDMFRDDSISAIFSGRGGNRAITMLPQIDFDLIRQNPKICLGYSDLTILLNGIYARTGLVTFHGPVFREMPKRGIYFDQMIALLSGRADHIDLPGATYLRDGQAEGTLIGGNLSLFQTLLGTPYLPALEGAILFLEDVGDHISRYDRMLGHLRAAGVFSRIAGLVIGDFTNTKDDEERPFGFTLEDCVREHTADYRFPVMMNAPFGHGDRLPTFPVGCRVRMDGSRLILTENPVA